MKNNCIFVAEGRHDFNRLKNSFKDIFILTTNGFDINSKLLDRLSLLSLNNEIILLMDDDKTGNEIVNLLLKKIRECIVIKFPNKAIEDTVDKQIKEVITPYYKKPLYCIEFDDLIKLKLVNDKSSNKLRNKIIDKLNFEHGRVNLFLSQLNMFMISKTKLINIMENLNE